MLCSHSGPPSLSSLLFFSVLTLFLLSVDEKISPFSSHTCTTTRWTSFLINYSFTIPLSSALWLCLLLIP
ncbi:hypothetical protein G5714_004960 [Onychostoma macrolepis]|uniref:Uncharacterized protein n=1 Tax=Onychostoma macrolepis TaxID=369639 RepID=A0A7J6D661_9TELE|nr:hypothetical protein G5714_004960 [Onychostoma macrolepis]